MKIGYIKHDKFIITIADLSTIPYYNLMKFSSTTNNFKILFIEDIIGKNYDSIEFSLYCGRFFDRDIYEIHYTKSMKIQIDDIIDNENSFSSYFYDKPDAFFSNFFKDKQWRLFEFGYTNLCKFNIEPSSYTIEVLINNGKIIGTVRLYVKNNIYYDISFDNINLNGIVEYQINGEIFKIKKEEFMINCKELNIFEYFEY